MKKLFISFSLMFGCLLSAQSTDFYISAHPDDWQLFMNPNAYKSVKTSGNKVVIIHTTAGDAGQGAGTNYYLAREEGSLRGIRFVSNAGVTGLGTNMNETSVTINGHNILKFTYRNITAYFLRLPDGNMDGSGFPLGGNPSLQKLYNGLSPNIKAIDGSTTYTSLEDLKTTLKSIVNTESQGNSISFNMADTDVNINPNDHSDHLYSSKIIQDISPSLTGKSIKLNLYVDYHSQNLNMNLSGDDYLIEVGTWGATNSGITDKSFGSTWEPGHNSWLGRQYFRTQILAQEQNIALNKPTSSSSNEMDYPSSNANDGNITSYWGASPSPQWWQVDLAANYSLSKINVVTYSDGVRYYQYEVLASKNGVNWTQIVDFTTNISPANPEGNTFTINNTVARYLRVNMKYNSANPAVHIREFKAYGTPAEVTLSKNAGTTEDISTSESPTSIYPNPVKQGGTLRLNIPLTKDSDVKITIYDMNANEVYNKKLFLQKNDAVEVPTQSLKKGIYIVKVGFSDSIQTHKIIIE